MHEAACLDLMDQYQVGRPPVKLHQGCLSHALFRMRLAICSPMSCPCQTKLILIMSSVGSFNISFNGSRDRMCVLLMIVRQVTEERTI